MENYVYFNGRKLRYGYTTGSSATAATKAALILLLGKVEKIEEVEIDVPAGKRIKIGIKSFEKTKDYATATVVKDGGDDPDVTHGLEIVSKVSFRKDNKIRIFETLKDDIEVIITIAAKNIVDLRKIQDKGITYADETIYIAKVLEEKGIKISGIVISRYYEDIMIDNYINKLKDLGYKVYKHYNIEGYPLDIENVVSENGLR